jgi:Putative DNA-binding domain
LIPAISVEWSFERLQLLTEAGKSESDRHDFKLNLPDARILTKLVCAFANTYGGFLIIGVSERDGHRFTIEGIHADKELYGKFVDKIRCAPSIAIEMPIQIRIPNTTKSVYVFEVRRSLRGPHLPIPNDERLFWKREGSACKQMSLEEIRHQILNYEEKREKLQLFLIDLHNKLASVNHEASVIDGGYTGEIFSFEIIDRTIVESFSLIKDQLQIFRALESMRTTIWNLNSQKQIMLNFLSLSYTQEDKIRKINEYRAFVQNSYPILEMSVTTIEKTLKDQLDIINPYKQI